jgi:hypothetical protein
MRIKCIHREEAQNIANNIQGGERNYPVIDLLVKSLVQLEY